MGRSKVLGSQIKVVKGIFPEDTVPATITGPEIDRAVPGGNHFLSCVLHLVAGAATGSPTAQTVDAKLQESDVSGSGFTDVTGGAVTQLVADDTESEVDVNLEPRKRFIRTVVVVTLTAGSSPTIPVAATVALGGAVEPPV